MLWFLECKGEHSLRVEGSGLSQVTGRVCDSAGERTLWRSLTCVPTPKVFPVWGLCKPWWFPGIRCPWVHFCPVSYLLPLSPHGLLASTASLAMAWCPCMEDHLAWVTLNPGNFLQQGPPSRWGSRGRGKDLPSLPTGHCQHQGFTDGHVSSRSTIWKLEQVVSLSLLAYSIAAVANLLRQSHFLNSLSVIKIPNR